MATIHPGLVVGAPIVKRTDSESIRMFMDTLNGKFYPAVGKLAISTSSLDDVAAAHALAAVIPEAEGRYLIARVLWIGDLVYQYLKDAYPRNWLPKYLAPIALLRFIAPLLGVAREQIDCSYTEQLPEVDVSKAERELGLKLSDLKQATLEMCDKLVEFGLAKKL